MPLLILLIFIGLPLAEISLFIEVGGEIGAGSTILLTIATAVAGITLARLQGFAVMARMQESVARGQPPVAELVHGFFLFLAGIFLFIPGFLTDTLGVLLLLPPVRMLLGRSVLRRFAAGAKSGAAGWPGHGPGQGRARGNAENIEIEGVYWEDDADGGAEADPTLTDRPGDQPKGRRED
ncbi:MAG: FxsA family protein [Proteobacteria bacterium]|nr:FxsA family protein [Pseudomonadota bacterium]